MDDDSRGGKQACSHDLYRLRSWVYISLGPIQVVLTYLEGQLPETMAQVGYEDVRTPT